MLNEKGVIEVGAEKPGLDGFVIKTLDHHHKNILALASAEPRGCLYAVYHLLENYANVGFFPVGGENIPKEPNLSLGPIDLSQRPQFPDREYFQGCAYSYSAQFWGVEDWKREIDWMAKKKLNLLHLTLGAEEPMKRALESYGVEMPPLTEWNLRDQKMLKEVFAYARSLGIRVVGPAFNGYVPAAFRKKYPGTHYVQVDWQGVDINQLIYPDDPMFAEISTRFLKEYIRIFGTDHYYNIDPFPETDPGKDQAEKDNLKRDFAAAVVKGIRDATPKASGSPAAGRSSTRRSGRKRPSKSFWTPFLTTCSSSMTAGATRIRSTKNWITITARSGASASCTRWAAGRPSMATWAT